MKKVILLSGGMDSATLLWDQLSQGHNINCLVFDYGQRHIKELAYAILLVDKAFTRFNGNVDYTRADVDSILLQGSSQTTDSVTVPHGRYDEENQRITVVPNRNMIMLSQAVGYAISIKADEVLYGAHSGDFSVYPDCRPDFVQALSHAVELCDWNPPKLEAPYVHLTKGEICKLGLGLGVPFEDTWTCYEGGDKPCGLCGSCTERKEAFEFAGVPDPLLK